MKKRLIQIFMIQYILRSELTPADVLIVPFFEDQDFKKMIKAISGLDIECVLNVLLTPDFEGKSKQMQFVYTGEKQMPRLLLLGLGKKSDLTLYKLKQAVGAATIATQSKKAKKIAFLLDEQIINVFGGQKCLQEVVVALELAQYSYDGHKEKKSRVIPLEEVQFVCFPLKQNTKEMQVWIDAGSKIANSINWARTLGNTPPSIMTPLLLATEAETIAQKNKKVKVKILSLKEIERLKMGCLLGVAKGSEHEPKFIIVEYWGGKKSEAPTVLVGKGITYDSGGLSLKPGEFLTDMKFDMLGGATVLGVVRAAAALGLKRNLVVLVPACENMPSGSAYRPDDILTAMNGKTVLIQNTDAEGRLVLADGLCYAAKYKPKEVIDFATLTGACVGALGNERSGVFSDQDKIVARLSESSEAVGEQLWRLPLGEEYMEAILSDIADVKNLGGVGGSRYAGASTAAAFLQYFTLDNETGEPNYPWAHIDLSCSHWDGKGKPWMRGGANGFGVETMIEYLKD